LFAALFAVDYLKAVVLPKTNKVINAAVLYGELLRWFGLWFLMATTNESQGHDCWSSAVIDPFRGAPFRFGGFMSRQRFDTIQTSLRLTFNNPPAYKDRFWIVRQLIAEWNKNMTTKFLCRGGLLVLTN
jgi:Transposase IS4